MSETYSLILNSQTSNNIIDNTSLSAYKYNINWDSVLPRINPNQKYSVTFQFKSANASTVAFSGAQTATVLTVNNMMNGQIYVGMQYFNNNALATVNSFGTGVGGVGTYNITGVANAATTGLYSTNTTFLNNINCSINFGYNTVFENNNQTQKIGALYPYSYQINQNVYSTNYNCSVLDNGPITIGYPSNQVITVSFTNLDGSAVSRMPHYQLQLYFEPIDDE